MLEFLGAILLIFLVMVAVLIWFGVRLARRVMRNVRALAGQFTGTMATDARDPRWREFGSLLDWRQRDLARLAHQRIEALLAERRSTALTPDEAQLMTSCERRVPELLDACLDRCRTARADERCDYAAPTLERLIRIGEEAEAARAAIRDRDDGRLSTMHNYFDSVTARK